MTAATSVRESIREVYVTKFMSHPCEDPESGARIQTPPPEKSQNIGLLSNISPDPLLNHKATKTWPAFNVGPSSARQRNAFDGPRIVVI